MDTDKFSSNHFVLPEYRQRVTRKDAQKILMNHETVICRGSIYEVKCKSIGAGIYEIYKTKKEYK